MANYPTIRPLLGPEFVVDLTSGVSGVLPVANGGTGTTLGAEKGFAELQQIPITASGTTTVTVTLKGPCRIDVNGAILSESGDQASAATAVTGTDLYHVYVQNDGSNGITVSISNTDPVWNDTTRQWHQTGDATKRWLSHLIVQSGSLVAGQVWTSAVAANGRAITHSGYSLLLWNVTDDRSAAWTTVSLVDFVPPAAASLYVGFSIFTPSAASFAGIGMHGTAPGTIAWSAGAFYGRLWAGTTSGVSAVNTGLLPTDSGQAMYYRTSDAGVDTAGVLKNCTYGI